MHSVFAFKTSERLNIMLFREKMTGETQEVCSDKRKPREDREKREETEKNRRNRKTEETEEAEESIC